MGMSFLVILSMVLVAFPAFAADPTQTVQTSAQITGAGVPPVVEKKWELATGNMTQSLTGNIMTPDPAAGAVNSYDIWGLVSDVYGLGNLTGAFADIYRPGKQVGVDPYYAQLHCTFLPYAGNKAEIDAAIDAAIAHGVGNLDKPFALDQLFKNQWIAVKCQNVYTICEPKVEPCGAWTVNVWAVDTFGTMSLGLQNTLNIACIRVLSLDFTGVDYGPILPTVAKWVRGDVIFGSGMPTIENFGNIAGLVDVASTKMIGVNQKKEINEFDVKIGTGSEFVYNSAAPALNVNTIDPCTPYQIDFSIHPGSGIPADVYTGTMTLTLHP